MLSTITKLKSVDPDITLTSFDAVGEFVVDCGHLSDPQILETRSIAMHGGIDTSCYITDLLDLVSPNDISPPDKTNSIYIARYGLILNVEDSLPPFTYIPLSYHQCSDKESKFYSRQGQNDAI